MENSTRETLQNYFKALNEGGWDSFVADDMVFVSPSLKSNSKSAYVGATKRFLQIVKSVELRQLIIEGTNACAVARYNLQSPNGDAGVCDVAEMLSVKAGKLRSSTIFFDSAAANAFIAPFAPAYKEGRVNTKAE